MPDERLFGCVCLVNRPSRRVWQARQIDAYKAHQFKQDNANGATVQDSLYCNRLFIKSVYCIAGE
jgi:hypothetical protein